MASNLTTQGQEAVECDLCQNPVSFFCRRCGVSLCDSCVPDHLRISSKVGHDVVDFTKKGDDECSVFCKTCDLPNCEHKSHDLSELSVKIKEVLKSIAQENCLLQSLRHELETSLDPAQIQEFLKREVEEKIEGLMKRFFKTIVCFFLFTLLNYFLFISENSKGWIATHITHFLDTPVDTGLPAAQCKIDENDMQNYFGNIGKMLESKLSMLEKRFIPDQGFPTAEIKIDEKDMHNYFGNIEKMLESKLSMLEKRFIPDQGFPTAEIKIDEKDMHNYFGNIEKMLESKFSMLEKRLVPDHHSGRKVLEVPSVSTVIDTGFPADEKYNTRLYDMAVTDDQKVWMGGASKELKLFDLQGHLHRTVTMTTRGMYICMYNKQVVYSDHTDNTVKKISDDGTVKTMFSTWYWQPYGITDSAFGDLLVCLYKDYQSKVVRYSSTGTVLQEIQYVSQSQPLYQNAWHIAENVNGDIIVTEFTKKKVIAVDISGIFRYTYSGRNNDLDASSVATDSVGHVYVTDFRGHKIHMLDRDGRFLRYIIPEGGINFPSAVCLIGDGEMIVGEYFTGLAIRIKLLK